MNIQTYPVLQQIEFSMLFAHFCDIFLDFLWTFAHLYFMHRLMLDKYLSYMHACRIFSHFRFNELRDNLNYIRLGKEKKTAFYLVRLPSRSRVVTLSSVFPFPNVLASSLLHVINEWGKKLFTDALSVL